MAFSSYNMYVVSIGMFALFTSSVYHSRIYLATFRSVFFVHFLTASVPHTIIISF